MSQETFAERELRIARRKQDKINRKLAKQAVTPQADGTEVIHSKESRMKVRRWSFQADVELVMPKPVAKPAEGGMADPDPQPEKPEFITLPMRTLKLDGVSYCSARDVKEDIRRHEAYLRANGPLFRNARIAVRAIPHETVSNETLRQLEGYRDMAAILDKALDMAIEEAGEVVVGKIVGTQFVEKAATEANGDVPAKPAVGRRELKEDFYKRALSVLTPKPVEPEAVPAAEPEEEKQPFVPEIVLKENEL